jgi:hypothetical protein
MPAPDPTPASEREATQLAARFVKLATEEAAGFGELLAGLPDNQLLGRSEFELRKRVHALAARFLATALEERKKGGTRGPARSVGSADPMPNSTV